MRKIIFNETEVSVSDCYPYRYENGKEVLRITTTESTFDILKGLDGYTGAIQYFEDEVVKTEYSNYSIDFTCNYSDSTYSVELTRVGTTEIKLQEATDRINELSATLDSLLFDVIPAFTGGI